MIEFKDVDGDAVRGYAEDSTGCYAVELEDYATFAVLTPSMARALAADLLKFAD